MRKFLKILGVGCLALLVVIIAAMLRYDARYFSVYDPGLPFHVKEEAPRHVTDQEKVFGLMLDRDFEQTHLSFESRPGERVPATIAKPVESEGKLPLILLLHGSHQDKKFMEEICTPFVKEGFMMASFDQHMRGGRKIEEGLINEGIGWANRGWKTVNDARRFLDYLVTRPDVDTERIYFVGCSYGAITGTSLVAFDKRIQAAVLVVGGGNLPCLMNAPLIRNNLPGAAWLCPVLGQVAKVITRPLEPTRYAPATTGTPVLMLNGNKDSLVTPEAGEALFEALGEPKELRWYACDHPSLRDEDGPVIMEILAAGKAWLLEKDAPFREASKTAKATPEA